MSLNTNPSQQAPNVEPSGFGLSRDLWVGMVVGGIVGSLVSLSTFEASRQADFDDYRQRICWEMGGDEVLTDTQGFVDCVFSREREEIAENEVQ